MERMKNTLYYYKVAGLAFGIELNEGIDIKGRLGAYEPFIINQADELLFKLPVVTDEGILPCGDNQWNLLYKDDFKGVITNIFADGKGIYHYVSMHVHKPSMWSCVDFSVDLRNMQCRVHGDTDYQLFALNNALMLMFSLASSQKDTLLFHASVIMQGGKGYLFLGKSGTGKSTHSCLWLKYIPGSVLLNDDYPAVRFVDGVPLVFGTPWSGKTPCYKNEQVPVGCFVRLWQATTNEIEKLPLFQAYAALLPTISNIRWEKQYADSVSDNIARLIQKVPVFSLKNRPEKEAAIMCFDEIKH